MSSHRGAAGDGRGSSIKLDKRRSPRLIKGGVAYFGRPKRLPKAGSASLREARAGSEVGWTTGAGFARFAGFGGVATGTMSTQTMPGRPTMLDRLSSHRGGATGVTDGPLSVRGGRLRFK